MEHLAKCLVYDSVFYDTVVTNTALLLCSLVTKSSTRGPYLELLAESSGFGLATAPLL